MLLLLHNYLLSLCLGVFGFSVSTSKQEVEVKENEGEN